MEQLIPRVRLENRVRTCLEESPVTVLLGARQTGKTTLAKVISSKREEVRYFDGGLSAPGREGGNDRMNKKDMEGCAANGNPPPEFKEMAQNHRTLDREIEGAGKEAAGSKNLPPLSRNLESRVNDSGYK